MKFEIRQLLTSLDVIANKLGRELGPEKPLLNAQLPDRSRLAAVIPPVVRPHPSVNIRKFARLRYTLPLLIEEGVLDASLSDFLGALISSGKTILISGGTGSGKTTLLNALTDFIPRSERIVVIEDTSELRIAKINLLCAECQTDGHAGQVSFNDLLKAALRWRPDRIILGEVRGDEARTLLDSFEVLGGHFTFATVNKALLTDLLPPFVHVLSTDAAAGRIRLLLDLISEEPRSMLPGSSVMLGHFMEVVLIEIVRSTLPASELRRQDLVTGLSNPQLAVALRAIHQNISRRWTVAELAGLAGMCRSVFSSRFSEAVGRGPIDYLVSWRMAIAKDAIKNGTSFADIAFAIGYQSAAAFSTAFTRVVGCSPKHFADRMPHRRRKIGHGEPHNIAEPDLCRNTR